MGVSPVRKAVPERVQKQLFLDSGSSCAKCKIALLEPSQGGDPFATGHIAHIEAAMPGGPRYNPTQTDEERNSFANLIVLCERCHGVVDQDLVTYTVGNLKTIKREHSEWRQRLLERASTEITFAELYVVVKYLLGTPPPISWPSYEIVPVGEKVRRNQLDEQAIKLLHLGLGQSRLVESYLNRNPDPEFSARLRDGFVRQYLELKEHGATPMDNFLGMVRFATADSHEPLSQAAGLAVLAYFFELCEVFEK
jgi:hypothetical protein